MYMLLYNSLHLKISMSIKIRMQDEVYKVHHLAMIKNPSNNSWMHMVIRITPQFNQLFPVSLPSYPENFIKIC